MWESLCNLQSEIETREQKIRESSNQGEPLSREMVQSIINKWEEIQTTATTLRPALQVINYVLILFTKYMYIYVCDLRVHVYMGPHVHVCM